MSGPSPELASAFEWDEESSSPAKLSSALTHACSVIEGAIADSEISFNDAIEGFLTVSSKINELQLSPDLLAEVNKEIERIVVFLQSHDLICQRLNHALKTIRGDAENVLFIDFNKPKDDAEDITFF